MPVFEVLGGTRNVNATLNYCENEQVTNSTGRKINKCALKAGVNCDIADIRSDFEETRNYFNKNGGRQGMHFVLSFNPRELRNTLLNQQKCLEIGTILAEKIAQDHESGVFVHVDQDHLHCHIVTNAVAFKSGKKYHMEKDKDLVILRNLSDEVCKDYGIQPLEAYKGAVRAEKSVEKRILDRGGVTWKSEIVQAVKYAKENALSEDHFKALLAEKGVERYQRGEKSFGYEHVGQREAGKTKYRMRDTNKALEGNHYSDVLKQIQANQNPPHKNVASHQTLERTQPAFSSPIHLPPVTDDFEKTIALNKAKKSDIRAHTSRQLAESKTEAERAQIKQKEAFELQQAEIDKEIHLKEAEFYKFFDNLQSEFSYTTHSELEKEKGNPTFYFGGSIRKKYRVSFEKEREGISFSTYEEDDYKEVEFADFSNQEHTKRLKKQIYEQAENQVQQAIMERRRQSFLEM